ncbi:MAG: methyltransferase domain-containing protein, partial [Proteobacteria bacterium]|nr:methyltransferase domain-containing protein [Pseudomonadota bacterium]
FPDASIDRVLLVHALECSEQVRPMLREVWRVLADGGRLLVVVPNRRGIWARFDRSPFGHGQPYTVSQLSRLLRDNLFTPIAAAGSLFAPPSHSRMMLAAAPAWERLGSRWFQTFAGVVLIEAGKQIYAASPARAGKRKRRAYLPIGQSSQRGMVKS